MIDRIVVVNSAAFTGSTWLCYVLSSHPKAFSLGNPGKVWPFFQKKGKATCRIHYDKCPFWQKVADLNPAKEDFLPAIAEVSGCTTMMLYNLRDHTFQNQVVSGGFASEVVYVKVIRDIRQRYASWKRRHAEENIAGAIGEFFSATLEDVSSGDIVYLRHERLSSDRDYVVESAKQLTGLPIDQSAITYWKHEHHPGHGNGVTHATCRHFQNPNQQGNELHSVYLKYLQELEQGTNFKFDDNRWEQEVSRYERFVIDLFCGDENLRNGYKRDSFTESEAATFLRLLIQQSKNSENWAGISKRLRKIIEIDEI